MYEEEGNEKRQTLKGIFVKIVLVVLLIFVLMMLFPTRGFVTNYVDEKVSETGGVDNFNNNHFQLLPLPVNYY